MEIWTNNLGAWVAQSVRHPTLAQVMISQFVSLSPTSGFDLTDQSREPDSDTVSLSLSDPAPLLLCLSKINVKKNFNKLKGVNFHSIFSNAVALARSSSLQVPQKSPPGKLWAAKLALVGHRSIPPSWIYSFIGAADFGWSWLHGN